MAKPTTLSHDSIRAAAEADLLKFIRLVAPHRVLGHAHIDLVNWWTRSDAKQHQLALMPRDHQKSALIAYRVAWKIVRDPSVTILYISSTANLAEKQLKMIKDILTSKWVARYWPDLVNQDEGKREKWSNSEISVDHPIRKAEGIRDPTVFTGGLTTSMTGMHCKVAVLDDVVVQENAYTEEGRDKVASQYSLLASIESADAEEWVVGTRYHPRDLYGSMIEMEEEVFDEDGNVIRMEPVYEVYEKQVEDLGDGTGNFLWPRQQRYDGKWFGFDRGILAKKKAQYLDRTQFYAQYYNNPNAYEESSISPSKFQYYDRVSLVQKDGRWWMMGKLINVFAAVDFAFTVSKKADYTAIAVIGIDLDKNIYALDIVRFKTEKISDIFEQIRALHIKWNFRKLRCEMTAAQAAVVRELRDSYIQPHSLRLSIDEYYPQRDKGSKEERINAILQPRYENLSIWHYRGGHCQSLEEELVNKHPPHDDLKDALAAAIDVAIPPLASGVKSKEQSNVVYHPRFGGIGA